MERICKNPLVDEPITLNKVNPAWDRFPTPLSVIRLVSLWITMTYGGGGGGNFSEYPIAPERGSPAQWRGGSKAAGEAPRIMAPPPSPQSCFFVSLSGTRIMS